MPERMVQDAVVAQMSAALSMLGRTIESFPESLWVAGKPNPSWRIAYHTLFYTDLYLSSGEDAFTRWEKHHDGANRFHEDALEPYTRHELLEYYGILEAQVDTRVQAVPLDGPSGFSWLQMTRLEVHLYNLRHLSHHTGQLADRLRDGSELGTPWVRRGRSL